MTLPSLFFQNFLPLQEDTQCKVGNEVTLPGTWKNSKRSTVFRQAWCYLCLNLLTTLVLLKFPDRVARGDPARRRLFHARVEAQANPGAVRAMREDACV